MPFAGPPMAMARDFACWNRFQYILYAAGREDGEETSEGGWKKGNNNARVVQGLTVM